MLAFDFSQNIKNQYISRKAVLGPEQSIIFKEDKISLDIPKEGRIVQDEWKIVPTIPPKVRKKNQVAFFVKTRSFSDFQETG